MLQVNTDMKLFGTDGLRAVAGEFPLDSATLELLGRVLCVHFQEKHFQTELIIGQDTRESGDAILSALRRGFCDAGGRIDHAGVISTPALAYLARKENMCAISITASHNPYRDNGIKIFGPDGFKISEESEAWIEPFLLGEKSFAGFVTSQQKGENREMLEHFHDEYCNHLTHELFRGLNLAGLRIALDCANGALYRIAPEVIRQFGAEVTAFHVEPDGKNINERCGALHPDILFEETKNGAFDCGFTFDGDGDRCLVVDKNGIYDGDFILAAAAVYLKTKGQLKNHAVVATPMSNMGLEVFLRHHGIELHRVPVGDKNVLEKLRQEDLSLGGEQSGHIIFMNDTFIGDGLMTALHLLRMLRESGHRLADLCDGFVRFPQILLNIQVRKKPDLKTIPEIGSRIEEIEKQLGSEGRIVVRYSGTEMLVRIMIEGPDHELIQTMAQDLGWIMKDHLN